MIMSQLRVVSTPVSPRRAAELPRGSRDSRPGPRGQLWRAQNRGKGGHGELTFPGALPTKCIITTVTIAAGAGQGVRPVVMTIASHEMRKWLLEPAKPRVAIATYPLNERLSHEVRERDRARTVRRGARRCCL
jgi:hypothetical protein